MKKKGLLRTVIGMSLMLLLAMTVALAGGCAPEKKMYKIGITQIVTHPALDAIRGGCIAGMADAGFVEGENVEYDFLNPEGDMSVATTIADKFVSEKKDLIISITTPCTQAVCAAAKGTDIPIVFIAVTDPVLAGIVECWENPCFPGLHITGVSDYIPVEPQLEIIKEICPDAKVLGAIYNAGDESNTKTVSELKTLAPKFGLEVIEANVATTADTHSAAMSLVGRADIAWSPMCNTTVAGLEGVLSVCEEHDIPYFPPDPDSVKRGGIASIYYSNEELGEIASRKAAKVLRGEDPCNIPVTTFETVRITLNPAAAERMGATIPQSVLDKAYEVVGK
jgi:putative ABC transport system substrate-binding protein